MKREKQNWSLYKIMSFNDLLTLIIGSALLDIAILSISICMIALGEIYFSLIFIPLIIGLYISVKENEKHWEYCYKFYILDQDGDLPKFESRIVGIFNKITLVLFTISILFYMIKNLLTF